LTRQIRGLIKPYNPASSFAGFEKLFPETQPTPRPAPPLKRVILLSRNNRGRIQENLMPPSPATRPDEGMKKGAVEDDAQHPDLGDNPTNSSMSGQLGHRDQDEMLKDADTDFPEPDAEAEHSGK
jgi:hypothetical protein